MKVEWKEVKGKVLVVVDVEDSIRVCCLCCSKGDGDVGLAEDVVPDVASHRAVFVEDLVHDILGNVSYVSSSHPNIWELTYPSVDLSLVAAYLSGDMVLQHRGESRC